MTKSSWVALLVLSLATSAAAHHGLTGLSGADLTRRVTVRGAIFSVAWENPHVSVALDVRAASGSVERWIVALPPPHVMTRKGLGREVLKVGDVLSATGYTATGSQRMNSAEFTLTDGRIVTTGNENWKPIDSR